MNKAAAMPAETLKKFAFTFALATAGLAIATAVVGMLEFEGLGFQFGVIIRYCINPVLLNLFILFVDDEKKKTWATHNIGGILLYIFFGGWSIFGAYSVLMFVLSFNIGYIYLILTFATTIVYTLDGLVGLVYYHNFRTAATSGGEPLMH
jgi:uncharacterized membrane protein